MHPLLRVDSVSLQSSGPTLTLSLGPGRSIGVFGPAASGKSKLLRVLAGQERPAKGVVELKAPIAIADLRLVTRRVTPESIAKKLAGHGGANRVAEALAATRLWDVRKEMVANLSDAQLEALELLPILAGEAKLLVIDGHLDALDPWTLDSASSLLAQRLMNGAALVLASNRAEVSRRVDTIVALKDQRIVFAGTYADLERKHPVSELIVETHDQKGVRALVEPFEVTMTEVEGGVKMQASEGQKIAAKLLSEGYGDVKSVVIKRPTPEELLRGLLT